VNRLVSDLSTRAPIEQVPDRSPGRFEPLVKTVEQAFQIVQQTIQQHEQAACRRAVQRLDNISWTCPPPATEVVYYPLYAISHEYKGRTYRAVLDGMKGTIIGSKRVSFVKLGAAAAIALVGCVLIYVLV
jgi:hypothetical protein